MNILIKFVMVSNSIDIENNYRYIEKKVEDITSKLNLNSRDYTLEELELSDTVSLDNNTDFYLSFKYYDIEYYIFFTFATYNNTKQLEVIISSNISDEKLFLDTINKSTNFVEQLKIYIKDSLLDFDVKEEEWKKCIWLLDKQSEIYASNLYPQIYKAENLFREFINSVMIRVFGVNWWNEVLPKHMSSKKDSSKAKEYKDTVFSLKDVDETLMCVNVLDLINILKLKFFKWECEEDILIEQNLIMLKEYISNTKISDMEKEQAKGVNVILNKLVSQLKENSNLWDTYFSQYLDKDFLDNIRKFNKNRNHVAHNKLMDRYAYESIKNNIELICTELECALNEFSRNYKSLEVIELIEREKEYGSWQEEYMELESGVEIRNSEEIYKIFEDAINKLYEEVSDGLRFRADIEVKNLNELKLEENEQILFKVISSVTKEEIEISCDTSIDDSQGEISVLNIIIKYNNEVLENYEITYVNGAVSFNSEQCTYMPETEDKFNEDELENSIYSVIETIDNSLENIREKVDMKMYRIIKDGGESPVAESIYCFNCEEEYICINEEYGEYGQCLNCGEHNGIIQCECCGNHVDEFNISLSLCNSCTQKYLDE